MSLISNVVVDASASVAEPAARSMVHAFSDSTTSTVRYTVPSGRKFVGNVIGKNTDSYFRLTQQNNEDIIIGNYSSNSGKVMPLELLAGQTVTGYYFHIIGVESDE